MHKTLFKNPTRMDDVRAKREDRERKFGPRLDAMDSAGLLRRCRRLFPQWPFAFGQRFSAETAREDVVLRRLLLFDLERTANRVSDAA